MNNVSAEKALRELSAERDFPPTPLRYRYTILSTPRSGSTLIGRVLYETGLAGDPLEYFNPRLLKVEHQRSNDAALDLNGFFRQMVQRRTSPNGYFGIKLHYGQWLRAFGANQPTAAGIDFLGKQDALIWIRRRDRVGQAISLAIAKATGVWSTEDSRFWKNEKDIVLHPSQVLASLYQLVNEDRGWEALIAKHNFNVLELWYEDVLADYEATFKHLFEYLGLAGRVGNVPQPPIGRQAGTQNERLRRELHDFLGLPEYKPMDGGQ